MSKIIYSIGDSVVWGAELENKQEERFSHYVANHFGAIDCNNATAGVSNDYIYRHAVRDIMGWLNDGSMWSEETGWVNGEELIVVIGWTAPTRFEWWDGKKYQQERLWSGYDKWGEKDWDRTTEDEFVLHQTELIPSYIRTFNHIIGIRNICDNHNITNIQFNTFYRYKGLYEPTHKIDTWGREQNQISAPHLWSHLSPTFTKESMYKWLEERGGELLPRNHPTKESHYMWSNKIIDLIQEQNEDEF